MFFKSTLIFDYLTILFPAIAQNSDALSVSLKMVLLHVKKTDTDQFIHSTSLTTQTDEIIATLVGIVNTRLKIDKVA